MISDSLSTKTTTLDGQTITFSGPHRATPDISLVGDPLIDAGCTPLAGRLE